MPINAFPINTVEPTANLIVNSPVSPVTATDVQAAINQLANMITSLVIPSPGPGTDPLFLTQGLSVRAQNSMALSGGSHGFIESADFRMAGDSTLLDPGFPNVQCLTVSIQAAHGQGNYGASTQSKVSFMPMSVSGYYNATGQRFLYNNFGLYAFGMGDACTWANNYVQFASGPIPGDEGVGWGSVSNLQQQTFLVRTHITNKPTQATLNTTTTQAIVASRSAQTINVASTASGVTDGDWVVVGQESPVPSFNLEPVQIIAHTATTITGIFRCNHASGVTVTPALVIWCEATFQMGQDRTLINTTKPAWGTANGHGTVSGISGGAFTGTGTGWSTGMVGGSATCIGAISLDADDYSGQPFNGGNGPLKSWYLITGVTDATHLGILTFSIAGDQAYRGKGPGSGGYTIRPAVRILRVMAGSDQNVTGQLICETTPAAWDLNDNVECVICPYADMTGFQWSLSPFTNGGTYRAFQVIKNGGARTIEAGIVFGDWGIIREPGADQIGWGSCFAVGTSNNIAFDANNSVVAGLMLGLSNPPAGITDNAGKIAWRASGAFIAPHSGNGGLMMNPGVGVDGVTAPYSGLLTSLLQFTTPGIRSNSSDIAMQMLWGGSFCIPAFQSRTGFMLLEDNQALWPNVNRWFLRVAATHEFQMGSETTNSGVVGASDFALMADNTEVLRLLANTHNLKLGAANFAANGTVATVLGSLGPSGAATTVQKWLKFQDSGGVDRFIPCF